ncbi:MAG: stage V sporulation protein AE [Clostridia bacterium]|nr:stage V sporulation protein AE [Clostridia bacterium]
MQYLWAFLIGGAICTIGQLLLSFTRLTSARILVLFVVAGVVLGGLGIYQPIVDFAGAGASVPLLGFGNALAKGAIDGAREHGILGAFSGGISATAAGISAAVLFGWLAALIFRPKTK